MLEFNISDTLIFCHPIDLRGNASRRTREKEAINKIIARIFGPKAILAHNTDGAPYIEGEDVNVSISHSISTAALAISKSEIIGIDVEIYRPQLERVAERVFSEDELPFYSSSPERLLAGWTLKEAIYKADSTPGLDFRRDIQLGLPPESPAFTPKSMYLPEFIQLPDGELLTIVKACIRAV